MQLDDLKKYISENREEIFAILDSERAAIVNSPEVKLLHGKYLTGFWEERPIKTVSYVIYFDEGTIAQPLNFDEIKKNLDTVITETLKTHRIIEVDGSFGILGRYANQITHDYLIETSNKNKVVFFFGENGIDVVVRGTIIKKINYFYDEEDRIKFLKKYHISNLQECLKEYERYINEPGVNEAFFASTTLVARIRPDNTPKNTLKNKPERIFRDNLISYLNHNTQHSFTKENELNNKRELDLYTEVGENKYLIEVKWLGHCVKDDESDLTNNVTDVSARNGVIQTLEYIQELFEKMNFNVHTGFLCVFDARDVKNPIDYQGFKFVNDRPKLLKYFKNHFIKLDEIAVNRHP